MTRRAWAGVAIAAVAGGFLIVTSGGDPASEYLTPQATTYSAGPFGAKALYLLFERLGLDVRRLRQPEYDTVLEQEEVLWLLSNRGLTSSERARLGDFVEAGGVLVAPAEPAAQLIDLEFERIEAKRSEPAARVVVKGPEPQAVWSRDARGPIVAAYPLGEGVVVFLGCFDALRNSSIGENDRATLVARLAHELGSAHVFDEFHTGYGDATIWRHIARAPYRFGALHLGVLLLLGIWILAPRERPAAPAARVRRREARDHVEAVATWWRRGGDVALPLHALCAALDERVRRRGGSASERPFVAWVAATRPELSDEVRAAWDDASRIGEAGASQKVAAAVRAAARLRRIESEVLR